MVSQSSIFASQTSPFQGASVSQETSSQLTPGLIEAIASKVADKLK